MKENDYSSIKAFFYDLDGTLFDHKNGYIRESTVEALKSLKNNSYKVFLNTSRSYDELYNVPRDVLNLFDGLLLLNGAYVRIKDEVKVKCIDRDKLDELIKVMDRYNLTYRYATKDGGGFLNKKDPVKEQLFYSLYEMTPPIKKYEGEDVLHMLCYANNESIDELSSLKDLEICHLKMTLEITPFGYTKGNAMFKMADELSLTNDELCAFGDSDNDFDMVKKAKLGIAMGNACDKLKGVADYITDDESGEGIYNALKKFGFI